MEIIPEIPLQAIFKPITISRFSSIPNVNMPKCSDAHASGNASGKRKVASENASVKDARNDMIKAST